MDLDFARAYVRGVAEKSVDAPEQCELHEMQNCAICNPPRWTYRRGHRLAVPEGL
jgi:hypothetical protein